ncbi:uncharacterized protein LOC113747714 [Larimichthys crocea]|uniref:uncharacterized protein LOC113747714 n=1 Tax=Larimichthys crocea TaxID=215358 RepID=UPI000F5E7663|nr:uncharacterized protein LOC113747714 [Larimichthys crocea]
MDQSDADQLNPLMSRVPEDNSRDNRPFPLPACVSSGLAAVISVFCIGLVSGAAGGLLLGATAVVMLQSLELLADNRLFMEQLEKYILRDYFLGWNLPRYFHWERDELVHDIKISIFVVMFGVFSSTLSLAAGIYIGLSTYSLVIKIKGEGAMGKALALAGLVCVTGVTATGYIVGFTLEKFISISLHVDIYLWSPTIGALIGVAGAVGVSLSAAVAVADQFGQALDRYGVVGRLGLTVGAAEFY